jgi:hypothetical protein
MQITRVEKGGIYCKKVLWQQKKLKMPITQSKIERLEHYAKALSPRFITLTVIREYRALVGAKGRMFK